MNQWAPKGSTAGAAAYAGFINDLQNRMQTQFAPVQLPNAPQLPPFLQAFAAGHQAGQQSAGQQGQGQGQAAPTVNINVNGQGGANTGAFNPQGSTAAMNAGGFMDTPEGRAALALLGRGGTPSGPAPTGPVPAAPGAVPATPATPAVGANTAYSTPPPITPPGQAFAQGMQGSMGSDVPAFANNYLNPMNMIGVRGY
jgi:hypothetical protein